MAVAATKPHNIGEEDSIWFKLGALVEADNPMDLLARLSEKYGGVIPVNLKNHRVILLSKVEHLKHVLITHVDNYPKYLEGLTAVFGRSMITVDGQLWQNIRKPQQPSFTPKMYAEYFPFLQESVRLKIDDWNALAESGEEIEMVEETWSLAADMVCKALFDRETPFNPRAVFRAVKAYTDVGSHKNIRLKKTSGELVEIDNEKPAQALDEWLSIPESVLGLVSRSHRTDTLLTVLQDLEADPDAPDYDRQQVLDEMKQYLWAGTETTALSLAWAFYFSTKYPEVAERIRQEADEVYGGREPTFEDMANLAYTRTVMQETMRMQPPAWALIRVADKEDEIDGHKIEPGDRIVMLVYLIHHSPQYWNDPETFDPGRFSGDRLKKRAQYSYLPFGAGKRACIGGQLSLVENTLALSTLLTRFNPEYTGGPIRFNATVTLTPKGGLPFKIRRRS